MTWCSVVQGQQNIDSLRNLLSQTDGEERFEVLEALAKAATQPLDQQHWGEKILDEAEGEFPYWEAMGLRYTAKGLYIQGKVDTAISLEKKAARIFESLEHFDKAALQLVRIGNSFTDLGKYDSALAYFDQARRIGENIKDTFVIMGAIFNASAVHHERGERESELELLLKALDLALGVNDTVQLPVMYFNLAAYYTVGGSTDKALEYLTKSEEMYRSRNDLYGLASTNTLRARIAFDENDFEEALHYLDQAAQNYEQLGERSRAASIRMNEGQTLAEAGRHREAESKLESAVRDFEAIGEPRFLAISLHSLGQVQYSLDKVDQGVASIQEAIRQSMSIGALHDASDWYETLSDILAAEGRHQEAYDALLQHSELKDSLHTINRERSIQEMEARFQNKQKQLEIENLEKEQELAQAQLEQERSQRFMLIGGLIAALILIVVVGYGFYTKRRDNLVIRQQKAQVEEQRDKIDQQRLIVQEKNQEILDSIEYAKRIQTAILPPDRLIKEHLKDNFVLYKPKDVVAGDFYWLEPIGDTVYFAAADCTGHGVPGAMVSVICVNGLNRAVREFELRAPGQILDKTRELVIKEFEKSEEDVKDGMDISLCALNTKTKEVQWAGAHNPLWIVRQDADEIEEIKADKQPIGKFEMARPFTTHSVQLNSGDTIYLFSDGYPDQFGGETGKKYKSGNFKRTLVRLSSLPIPEQLKHLDEEFESWKGDLDQIDDVCVIGLRV